MVFDPFSDVFCANPHAIFRQMREAAPVYYNSQQDFYALTRHADVVMAFKDVGTYSSTRGIDLTMIKSGQDPPKLISFLDPPEHGRMRGLLNKAFTARAMESLRGTVAELSQHYLRKADPRRFDVIRDFSALFPVDVITAMLGVPEEFRDQLRALVEEESATSRARSTEAKPAFRPRYRPAPFTTTWSKNVVHNLLTTWSAR